MFAINIRLHFIREEDIDDVGFLRRLGRGNRLKPVADRQLVVRTPAMTRARMVTGAGRS